MSATYSFLPWLRQGIANQIAGQSGQRATIALELTLRGASVSGGAELSAPPIQRSVEIYGPGDVVGIEPRAIIKTDPLPYITNFEPNYLAYIDFYDEDFVWRYSPVPPNGHRLAPWLALIVLKEGEFSDGKDIKDRPLPYVLTTAETKLPPPTQLWAWAHVHLNTNVAGTEMVSTDANAIQGRIAQALDGNPDIGYSRLLCPRRLEANTSYHALVVPAFESGRLAGLGKPPTGAAAFDTPAWTDAVMPSELPYYHRWYFRTGSIGDFEYLVRLLEPKPVDSRVGLRDMDVQKPGANITGILDEPASTDEQKLGGILKLGGALRIPDVSYTEDQLSIVQKYRKWATLNGTKPYPHPFQRDLASFINLSDSYSEKSAGQANNEAAINEVTPAVDPDTDYDIAQNPDPLITAPLYGQWHSLTQRLLTDRAGADLDPNDNWVHELNLDPRWRVAAGFGTAVVQDNQEDYMQAAWSQVGEVLESNKRIRFAQLSKAVSTSWHSRYLKPTQDRQPEQWLALSAPMHARVMTEVARTESGRTITRKVTMRHAVDTSMVPRAALSTGMRKLLRPRGTFVKRLPFDARVTPRNIVGRINSGSVSAAPPRIDPPALNVLGAGIPDFLSPHLGRHRWLKWLPLLLAVLLALALWAISASTPLWGAGTAVMVGLVMVYRTLAAWTARLSAAALVAPEKQTPAAIDSWPKSPDFRVSTDGVIARPSFGQNDSAEGVRFKAALKESYGLVQDSLEHSKPVRKPALDIKGAGGVLLDALQPAVTIPRWIYAGVVIPGRIRDQQPAEAFVEAMAYPEIDVPMYKPLVDRSSELFLPNLGHIAQNSISLLETNQPFIESYMVGLNHEFARELLWREYPTDQRGSYFRQFWEARGFFEAGDKDLDADAIKEKLRDIPPLHLWSKFSKLGDHDHREQGGGKEEEVVLVIRGELLKKYPNAVIYAQRAAWKDKDGAPITDPGGGQVIDATKERDLWPLTEAEQANPPRALLKTPLYEAKAEPDIYFFGFDLTACKAKGGTGKANVPVDALCVDEGVTWDDPGWFFVIKERPGEPRFGLDIGDGSSVDSQGRIEVWNDFGWQDLTPPVSEGGFIQITAQTQTVSATQPLEDVDDEKIVQQTEDAAITWRKDVSSAELAYILYQVPVLVAVHASEMLPKR